MQDLLRSRPFYIFSLLLSSLLLTAPTSVFAQKAKQPAAPPLASAKFDPRADERLNKGKDSAPAPLATTAGQLIISEFRLRGAGGATDEFIELYNTTGATLVTQASDASAGLGVAASDNILRCTVPNGTSIPAGGHYLCTNSLGYSLSTYPAGNGTTATADATYTTDIPDNAGIGVFNSTTTFAAATKLDAVGSASEGNAAFKEGTGYPDLVAGFSIEYSFYRDMLTGLPRDTNDNAADFLFVDTNANCGFVAGCATGSTADGLRTGRHLGAPGPENLSSPIQRNATIKATLIDPGCTGNAAAATQPCPRFRDPAATGTNASLGTLSIRRRFVNNTGATVTRLRFRIVDITTFPAISTADLRALTSGDQAATCIGSGLGCPAPGSAITIRGTTLETPPAQINGGAFNSSLSAGTITLGTPLAPGASVNIQFVLGVERAGAYRFFVNVEALP